MALIFLWVVPFGIRIASFWCNIFSIGCRIVNGLALVCFPVKCFSLFITYFILLAWNNVYLNTYDRVYTSGAEKILAFVCSRVKFKGLFTLQIFFTDFFVRIEILKLLFTKFCSI